MNTQVTRLRLPTVRVSKVRFSSESGDKFKMTHGPKEHSCGIPPWNPDLSIPPPPPPPEFPSHLIRPPCLPGSEQSKGFQACTHFKGYYCVPCRLKYKYPSFSENIDFVPPYMTEPPCWWKMNPSCTEGGDDKLLDSLTKRWPCNYE